MRLAFDDNLGLPADFAQRFGCELVSFHDVGAMLEAFESAAVQAMFAPCGALPYLKAAYDVLAQATFGSDRALRMQSRFVVRGDSQADAGIFTQGRIACVNAYCTTSYWAPMIARAGDTPQGAHVTFGTAAGFADMLRSVVDGRSDAAMTWDAVLAQHPGDAARVRELFRIDGLPTPAILSNASLSGADRERLAGALDGYAAGPPWFFTGFAAPDTAAIRAFDENSRRALAHYALNVTAL